MGRTRLALVVLALGGWLGAIASQVMAVRAGNGEGSSGWTVRRNRFLLLSSVCMNTLVFSAVYRVLRRIGGGKGIR